MADTSEAAKPTLQRSNRRNYEQNRPSAKYVAKRATAKDHGTDVAKLFTSFVDVPTERAFEYCGQLDEEPASAKAS